MPRSSLVPWKTLVEDDDKNHDNDQQNLDRRSVARPIMPAGPAIDRSGPRRAKFRRPTYFFLMKVLYFSLFLSLPLFLCDRRTDLADDVRYDYVITTRIPFATRYIRHGDTYIETPWKFCDNSIDDDEEEMEEKKEEEVLYCSKFLFPRLRADWKRKRQIEIAFSYETSFLACGGMLAS